MATQWITSATPRHHARARLFCLPYAGGGVAHYRTWAKALGPEIELCLIHLPGREQRLFEAPIAQMTPLAETIATQLTSWLYDLPYAFFGHSMGALIAFETSMILQERGHPLPRHVFLSAARAPHRDPRDEPIHLLPHDAFIARLRTLNGSPAEVLENAELMELLLPCLRADFTVSETYSRQTGPLLKVPLTILGGTTDEEMPYENLEAWQHHTPFPVSPVMFEGDHFFIHEAVSLGVVELIRRTLRSRGPVGIE